MPRDQQAPHLPRPIGPSARSNDSWSVNLDDLFIADSEATAAAHRERDVNKF
jgi:hypothetical protein